MPPLQTLTDEAVHVLRVPRIVWNGEVAVTDRHLALPERQGEVTQLVQQTAEGLGREHTNLSRAGNGTIQIPQKDGENAVACSTLWVPHGVRPTFYHCCDRHENKHSYRGK